MEAKIPGSITGKPEEKRKKSDNTQRPKKISKGDAISIYRPGERDQRRGPQKTRELYYQENVIEERERRKD